MLTRITFPSVDEDYAFDYAFGYASKYLRGVRFRVSTRITLLSVDKDSAYRCRGGLRYQVSARVNASKYRRELRRLVSTRIASLRIDEGERFQKSRRLNASKCRRELHLSSSLVIVDEYRRKDFAWSFRKRFDSNFVEISSITIAQSLYI